MGEHVRIGKWGGCEDFRLGGVLYKFGWLKLIERTGEWDWHVL